MNARLVFVTGLHQGQRKLQSEGIILRRVRQRCLELINSLLRGAASEVALTTREPALGQLLYACFMSANDDAGESEPTQEQENDDNENRTGRTGVLGGYMPAGFTCTFRIG